jgi:hypothetical protein
MLRPLFLRKLRRYVAAIPALAFGFVASPAFSTVVTINASGITAGANSANFAGATMTSTGGNFTKATSGGINPTQYIGISGGAVANELDRSQKLTLGFTDSGAIISEIVLGMIFLADEAGDKKNEAAQLQTLGGSCNAGLAACILSASGTNAVWRGAAIGNQNVLSPATGGNGGIFRIVNPFGSDLISQLQLMPFLTSLSTSANNSDFGLVSITYTTTAIPEPGTLVLVSLGMLGLVFAGRRRARG